MIFSSICPPDKNIAKYAVLLKNSGQKAIWKNYGFVDESQQITVLLAVMLFIMENPCATKIAP